MLLTVNRNANDDCNQCLNSADCKRKETFCILAGKLINVINESVDKYGKEFYRNISAPEYACLDFTSNYEEFTGNE